MNRCETCRKADRCDTAKNGGARRCTFWVPSSDPVNHPQHYTAGGIECIDALKAATEGLTGIRAVCAANAIKYIWRFSRKNGAEDIDKAIWYLHRLKAELAEETENRNEEDEIND